MVKANMIDKTTAAMALVNAMCTYAPCHIRVVYDTRVVYNIRRSLSRGKIELVSKT